MGKVVRECLGEITDGRPFLDTEHGPIHTFKDKKKTLPAPFDDEYFRHMSWAHLASGGVGGGMRWPNRRPHTLTHGMREAQRAMAGFLPLIDWARFARRNISGGVGATLFHRFACGDEDQALVWLLRRRALAPDGLVRADIDPIAPTITVPGLADGACEIVGWDAADGRLRFIPSPIGPDRAFAIRRLG